MARYEAFPLLSAIGSRRGAWPWGVWGDHEELMKNKHMCKEVLVGAIKPSNYRGT